MVLYPVQVSNKFGRNHLFPEGSAGDFKGDHIQNLLARCRFCREIVRPFPDSPARQIRLARHIYRGSIRPRRLLREDSDRPITSIGVASPRIFATSATVISLDGILISSPSGVLTIIGSSIACESCSTHERQTSSPLIRLKDSFSIGLPSSILSHLSESGPICWSTKSLVVLFLDDFRMGGLWLMERVASLVRHGWQYLKQVSTEVPARETTTICLRSRGHPVVLHISNGTNFCKHHISPNFLGRWNLRFVLRLDTLDTFRQT